jgi:hemerythrin
MDQLYALRARLKINPRLSGELEGFMVDWVLNHITSKDRVLASYLG